ncbi:hypothetical protein GC102_30900 [Paenibacillus sp. LMG 31460]|uniref:Uncharacterized protein n=2 Tax=Paenibacillus germinis TaxID=2654979 RepID=A0ABX1ZE07_9BACL|nr:hypothetical protein [Paenibacillus germinis]
MMPEMNSDPTELVVIKQTNAIHFYIKGTNPKSNRYLHYQLKRFQVPFDADAVKPNHNLDVWRMHEVYEVERTGAYSFANVRSGPIVHGGEWECAIMEKDASDFMGGNAHGDEIMLNARFFFDDVEQDPSIPGTFTCRSITFISHSRLFRDIKHLSAGQWIVDSTRSIPVAKHCKLFRIHSSRICLDQEIEWLVDTALSRSYFAMLPIKRKLLGASADQITDRLCCDSDPEAYDISWDGFTHEANRKRPGIRKVMAWGTSSGISAELEIQERNVWLPNENHHVSNAELYNKLYFDFSGECSVSPGDVWLQKAKYVLNTVN